MIKNLIKTSLLISIFSLWSPLPSFSMQLTDLDVVSSSFRKMPPEILGNIFRHLDRDSLINVSKVNQFFHASLLLNAGDQKLSQVFVDNLNEKLETLQNLHVLILDNVTSDDINDKCLPKYLADILAKASPSCPSLEILSISNISFHRSSFEDVMKLLASQPKQENHSSSFQPILGTSLLSEGEQRHFGGLLKELAGPIRKWQNLRILRMAYTYQNDYESFPIVELLNSLPESLEELDLRGSKFGPDGIKALGNEEGLPFVNNLKVLKLEDPVIDSAKELAYFLSCTCLEELTLIKTKNDASFFIELLEDLKDYAISESLVKLDISGNKEIGIQAGNKKGGGNSLFCDERMLLSKIFYFKNLQYLDIKNNGIKANFIDGFIEGLLGKKLPNLQYIGCIDGNDISLKKPKNIKDDYGDFLSGHNFECDEIPVKLPSEYNKIICKLEKLQGERNGFSFD